MPRKLRQLRGDLRRAGFRKVRQQGSHETWRHPDNAAIRIVLAGDDGADAKPYQEDDVRGAIAAVRPSKEPAP